MSNVYAMSGGVKIPAGADLNDYKEPGNYCCQLDALAKTVLHTPIDNMEQAFTMKVELSTGDSYPSQTIRLFRNGDIYYRMWTGEAWFDWRHTGADFQTFSYLKNKIKNLNNSYDGTSDSSNILFYHFSEENWAGIGILPTGSLVIRVGTTDSVKKEFKFAWDGHIYLNETLLI